MPRIAPCSAISDSGRGAGHGPRGRGSRSVGSARSEHRGSRKPEDHVGVAHFRKPARHAVRGLRHHGRRDPPLRRHEHPGSAAACARRRGRAPQRAFEWSISIRGFNSDLANKLLVLIDGRTRVLAAVRRRVLGRPGHAARGRRTHRGHLGSRRHALGRERGQRRHQHHHAPGAGHARRVRRTAAAETRNS